MTFIPPAERLVGVTLKDNWYVVEKVIRDVKSWSGASCYKVTRGSEVGFLKAFDLSGMKKVGGEDDHELLTHRFKRELSIIKQCSDAKIGGVVNLLGSGKHFHSGTDLNELVNYFILEYCADGDMLKCIEDHSLIDFASRCAAVRDICEAVDKMHANGVMHLDIKPENLIHFINERVTKIVDFGSARRYIVDVDPNLNDELNEITTTYSYAPFECLYHDNDWTNNWNEYRRKIDLFLVGTIIVRIFTNMTFSSLLRNRLADKYSWKNKRNLGKFQEIKPFLIEAVCLPRFSYSLKV
jgi:serine/threonine protein kinase